MVKLSRLSQGSLVTLAAMLLPACGGATGGGPVATFSASGTQGDWTRTLNGNFFGPRAAEAGGVFSASQGSSTGSDGLLSIEGSFGARNGN